MKFRPVCHYCLLLLQNTRFLCMQNALHCRQLCSQCRCDSLKTEKSLRIYCLCSSIRQYFYWWRCATFPKKQILISEILLVNETSSCSQCCTQRRTRSLWAQNSAEALSVRKWCTQETAEVREMLNELFALFSCVHLYCSECRVTHCNHSSAEQRRTWETPTQLDFALIIDEDVGTLEVREGQANVNDGKTPLNKSWLEYAFYIILKVLISRVSIQTCVTSGEKKCTETVAELSVYLNVSVNFFLRMQVVQALVTHKHTLNLHPFQEVHQWWENMIHWVCSPRATISQQSLGLYLQHLSADVGDLWLRQRTGHCETQVSSWRCNVVRPQVLNQIPLRGSMYAFWHMWCSGWAAINTCIKTGFSCWLCGFVMIKICLLWM